MDVLTKEQRIRNMKAIKSISNLEKVVSGGLWAKGYRFRRNSKDLYGRPDISIKKYKIVIFIDSCFWHQCPLHGNIPKTNTDFWQEKLDKNKVRDQIVNQHYKEKGWIIHRVWEHDIKNDLDRVINELSGLIDTEKNG